MRHFNLNPGVMAAAMTLVLISLTGCKGRTMENMTPTGDTVEIVPDTIAADDGVTVADTVAATDSTPL